MKHGMFVFVFSATGKLCSNVSRCLWVQNIVEENIIILLFEASVFCQNHDSFGPNWSKLQYFPDNMKEEMLFWQLCFSFPFNENTVNTCYLLQNKNIFFESVLLLFDTTWRRRWFFGNFSFHSRIIKTLSIHVSFYRIRTYFLKAFYCSLRIESPGNVFPFVWKNRLNSKNYVSWKATRQCFFVS